MIGLMNEYGRNNIPFLFCIDFEMENSFVKMLDEINSNEILYDFNGYSNFSLPTEIKEVGIVDKKPVSFEDYEKAFNGVQEHLKHGYSYLLNLTFRTQIILNASLKDVFFAASAKYKVWYQDEFVFFSPETFIEIEKGKIITHPMKGTIDAAIKNAEYQILNNRKEMAEHATIVDLLRNDLSIIAENIKVDSYRYTTYLKTSEKDLIQVSSAISGELDNNYREHLGDILFKMLPAGSVSGAPKAKTLEIISEFEQGKRGYFTGVCGIYDGQKVDSCVMIRYIEKIDNQYFYRSGGGITINSVALEEYNEMIDKVYVPLA